MEKLPYVISEELDINRRDTASVVKRNTLDIFRESLDTDLRAMGKQPYWVPSSDIASGLSRAIQNTQLPVVSLDDRYVTGADRYLGISRSVDMYLNNEGYAARQGYSVLEKQLEQIASCGREILLVDDVLFSGEMVTWLGDKLAQSGVRLGAVAVGVAMQDGINRLAGQGIDVIADIVFDAVEDEICERDLALVPGSGRRVASLEANALYFDTDNGKPEQWASIEPNAASAFCASSLERSLRLLRPGVPMSSIGKFIGYDDTQGTAANTITKRLGELS